ncbi:hypothetical protein AK821_06620 [Pseudomonas sp. RIT-PI-r]|nr:hypothetical protein AK821_06620 [Pseudomonas sp. RIT-PI-r]
MKVKKSAWFWCVGVIFHGEMADNVSGFGLRNTWMRPRRTCDRADSGDLLKQMKWQRRDIESLWLQF